MSTVNELGNAIGGLVELLESTIPTIAIVPCENVESDGLSKATNSIGRKTIVDKESIGCVPYRYFIIQMDIKDIQTRVHRYTAQKARFQLNEAEGDMVNMLALTPDEDLTFMEFLQDGVLDIYGTLSGYSRKLAFKACLLDEGVDIEVLTTAKATAKTFLKDSYIRVKDTDAEIGKIYMALQDIPVGTELENLNYWKPQPEYIDTKERVTFAIAEDNTYKPTWDIQTLELMWDNVNDYLFYNILYRWNSLAEREYEMNINLMNARDTLGNIKIGLDNKTKRHSDRESFSEGGFY